MCNRSTGKVFMQHVLLSDGTHQQNSKKNQPDHAISSTTGLLRDLPYRQALYKPPRNQPYAKQAAQQQAKPPSKPRAGFSFQCRLGFSTTS